MRPNSPWLVPNDKHTLPFFGRHVHREYTYRHIYRTYVPGGIVALAAWKFLPNNICNDKSSAAVVPRSLESISLDLYDFLGRYVTIIFDIDATVNELNWSRSLLAVFLWGLFGMGPTPNLYSLRLFTHPIHGRTWICCRIAYDSSLWIWCKRFWNTSPQAWCIDGVTNLSSPNWWVTISAEVVLL